MSQIQVVRKAFAAILCGLIFMSSYSRLEGQQPLYYATFGLGFGARALGMGGAYIAISDDITAMNYNPAGLAQLMKPEFSLGVRYGGQRYQSTMVITEDTIHDPLVSAYRRFVWDYFGGLIPFKLGKIPVVLGISQSIKGSDRAQYVYSWHYANYISPFTEKNVEYYQDNRVDNRGNISTLSFSLSVRPIQALHLGLNINLWDEDARGKWWNRNETISYTPYNESGVDFFSNEYIERFDHGTNFDFGLLLKLQKLSFGAVYRTSFKANFFRWDRWTWDQGTSVSRDEWQYDATLHWPESYALGLCVRPSDALTVSLDYNRANWSAGKVIVDDTLEEIGYPNYAPRDTQQLRAGVEYLVSRSRLAVPLRLGGFINEVFWSDWEDKPIRYYGFTCGAGLALKSITLDLAAIYSIGKYREVYVYANEIPYYDKVKEMDWEILLSITYRLW